MTLMLIVPGYSMIYPPTIKIVTYTKTPKSNISSVTNFSEIRVNITELQSGNYSEGFHRITKTHLELLKEDPTMDETTRRGMIWYELNWKNLTKKNITQKSRLPELSVSDQLKLLAA
jgi:hypothetical protein